MNDVQLLCIVKLNNVQYKNEQCLINRIYLWAEDQTTAGMNC